MRYFVYGLSLAAGAAFLVGCGAAPDTSVPGNEQVNKPVDTKPVNAVCPIMGGKVKPDLQTVSWNGETIGFCCDAGKCREKFTAMNDDEKNAALEEASKKAKEPAPEQVTEFDNKFCPIGFEPVAEGPVVEFEGKKIGFCCPGCDTAFQKLSKEDKIAALAKAAKEAAKAKEE